MQETQETRVAPPPRSNAAIRWLVAAAVVVLVVVVALAVRGWSPPGDSVDTSLRGQLADRVVTLLEAASPVQHADHGHHFGDEGPILCAVDPFGFEPADAATVEQVRVVYAHHLCAVVAPGVDWDNSLRASGPFVVTLSRPTKVSIPESGMGYPDRVRTLIPEQYQEEAFSGFLADDMVDQLRQRFAAAHAGS